MRKLWRRACSEPADGLEMCWILVGCTKLRRNRRRHGVAG